MENRIWKSVSKGDNRPNGTIWKDPNEAKWYVQFAKGIMGFRTKKRALECSMVFYPKYKEQL